jgi:ankyrin repeat protein
MTPDSAALLNLIRARDYDAVAAALKVNPALVETLGETPDGDEWLPLYAAVAADDARMVELLIAHGADVNGADGRDRTALWEAARKGRRSLCALLRERGATDGMERSGAEEPTLLCEAILRGDSVQVAFLLDLGASFYTLSEWDKNYTPLEAALAWNTDQYIQLPDGLPSISSMDSAAHDAHRARVREAMECLLQRGADPNKGQLLQEAIYYRQSANVSLFEEIELLLRYGADINDARATGLVDKERTLRYSTDDLGIRYHEDGIWYEGVAALHVAVHFNDWDAVEFLLAKGANPNVRDQAEATPLHYACFGSNISVARNTDGTVLTLPSLLVAHGADVNARDSSGKTPLHWLANAYLDDYPYITAEMWGGIPVLDLFLRNGADFDAKDAAGWTPLDIVTLPIAWVPPTQEEWRSHFRLFGIAAREREHYQTTPEEQAQLDRLHARVRTSESFLSEKDEEGMVPVERAFHDGRLYLATSLLACHVRSGEPIPDLLPTAMKTMRPWALRFAIGNDTQEESADKWLTVAKRQKEEREATYFIHSIETIASEEDRRRSNAYRLFRDIDRFIRKDTVTNISNQILYSDRRSRSVRNYAAECLVAAFERTFVWQFDQDVLWYTVSKVGMEARKWICRQTHSTSPQRRQIIAKLFRHYADVYLTRYARLLETSAPPPHLFSGDANKTWLSDKGDDHPDQVIRLLIDHYPQTALHMIHVLGSEAASRKTWCHLLRPGNDQLALLAWLLSSADREGAAFFLRLVEETVRGAFFGDDSNSESAESSRDQALAVCAAAWAWLDFDTALRLAKTLTGDANRIALESLTINIERQRRLRHFTQKEAMRRLRTLAA